MKLFDVLKENVLRSFAGNKNINVYVGPDSSDDELIKEIQKALSMHSLALGERPEGQWWPNDKKAWTGGQTGTYDTALANAVRVWQESVNKQIEDMPPNGRPKVLQINGVINQEDAKILLAPLNNKGFLDNRQLDLALKNFEGIRRGFDGQRFANSDVADVNTFADMIQSIGRDGWYAVITPIANQRFTGQFVNQNESMMKDWADDSVAAIMNKSRNAEILFDNLRAIMRPLSPLTTAPTTIGGEVKIIPDHQRLQNLKTTYLGPGNTRQDPTTPKLLYLHFASIAQFQFKRGAEDLQQRINKQEQQEIETTQNDQPTIDQLSARQIAEEIQKAFANNYWAIFTSGRVESDELSIEESLMKLSNAKDYDEVAKEYNELTGNILSTIMLDELPEDLYNRIFVNHLTRIRRINPRLLHQSINFGAANSVDVVAPNSDKEFTIMSVMSRNRPDIEPEVFDVILEDALLKKAVEQSGNTIPDLFRKPSVQEKNQAIATFIEVMNNTYPEMVRFYGHLPPFDEYSPIGPMRLKGIVEEATIYTNSGTDPSTFIEQSILKDRIWLVGTGEDADGDGEIDPGNANIYFDPRYQSEGMDNRTFLSVSDDKEIDLSNDDKEIINDLYSDKDDIITAAIDRIFEQNNPSKLYTDTIYPGFKQETGQFIEFELGGQGDDAWTHKFFSQDTTDSNPFMAQLLTKMAESLGKTPLEVIAFVAPKGVADEFKKALDRTTFFGMINDIDEDHLRKLIVAIQERRDFDLVDQYYDGKLQQDIKEKDWWQDDEMALSLLDKIGIDPAEADAAAQQQRITSELETLVEMFDSLENTNNPEDRQKIQSEIDVIGFVNSLFNWQKDLDIDENRKSIGFVDDVITILEPYLFRFTDPDKDADNKAKYGDIANYEDARDIYMDIYERLQ